MVFPSRPSNWKSPKVLEGGVRNDHRAIAERIFKESGFNATANRPIGPRDVILRGDHSVLIHNVIGARHTVHERALNGAHELPNGVAALRDVIGIEEEEEIPCRLLGGEISRGARTTILDG